jgi:phage shock protein A
LKPAIKSQLALDQNVKQYKTALTALDQNVKQNKKALTALDQNVKQYKTALTCAAHARVPQGKCPRW